MNNIFVFYFVCGGVCHIFKANGIIDQAVSQHY